MAGTNAQPAHREYFEGACIPYGYTTTHTPPKPWEVVIDGKTVTPKLIQRVLKRCKETGRDLEYIARVLGVGDKSINKFIRNEKTIPRTIAEKFVRFFSSDEKIPKAQPVKPPLKWSANATGPQQVVKTIDFEAAKLGEVFKAERIKRGKEYKDIAQAIKSTTLSIRRAEEGKILNQYGTKSIMVRLCDFYGIDVREYETKPRINYKLFREKLIAEKEKRTVTWSDIADAAGIGNKLMDNFKSNTYKHGHFSYLTQEMEAVLSVLGIDKNEILEKRE